MTYAVYFPTIRTQRGDGNCILLFTFLKRVLVMNNYCSFFFILFTSNPLFESKLSIHWTTFLDQKKSPDLLPRYTIRENSHSCMVLTFKRSFTMWSMSLFSTCFSTSRTSSTFSVQTYTSLFQPRSHMQLTSGLVLLMSVVMSLL